MGDWLRLWRPLCDPGSVGITGPASPLFILNGKAVTQWSRVLSILWERTYDRTMTATILRYWKATKVALCAKSDDERRQVLEADWCVCILFFFGVSVSLSLLLSILLFCLDSHGIQVAKKFYVKIFSFMDAKKAKESTDNLCRLELDGGWSCLTDRDDDTEDTSCDGTGVCVCVCVRLFVCVGSLFCACDVCACAFVCLCV